MRTEPSSGYVFNFEQICNAGDHIRPHLNPREAVETHYKIDKRLEQGCAMLCDGDTPSISSQMSQFESKVQPERPDVCQFQISAPYLYG